MKKLAIAFIALSFAMTAACKKEETKPADKKADTKGAPPKTDGTKTPDPVKEAPPVAVKLAPHDLSAGGDAFKGVTMQAPEGATGKESFGAYEVKAGDHFQMTISSSKADIAGWKKEIAENDVNKFKAYVIDSPDALLYESAVMADKPEFHFVANVKVGDKEFSCENTKGPTYTKADAEAMLKACQSLTAAAK